VRQLAEARDAVEADDVLDTDGAPGAHVGTGATRRPAGLKVAHRASSRSTSGSPSRGSRACGPAPEKISAAVHEFITTTLMDDSNVLPAGTPERVVTSAKVALFVD
jgi:hypothetical protein